jgi:hypothetical protein
MFESLEAVLGRRVVNVYRPLLGPKSGKTPNIGEPKEGRKT